jgi:probable phosphomutase (TIGR03848 family)
VKRVATLVLVRHGRSTANTSGVLAGRSPGVDLDEVGQEQARATGIRLAKVPLAAIVTSPLERCRQTADLLVAERGTSPEVSIDERLVEPDYGAWTGEALKQLAKDKSWKVVQQHASAAAFPGGGTLRQVQARAVDAVRDWDRRITEEHGPDSVWVAVSHGDVIKAILADAIGTHLDLFQRIVVDPGSVSVVSYTPLRPFVVRLNDTGDLSGLAPRRRRRRRPRSSDAAVGGGAGS